MPREWQVFVASAPGLEEITAREIQALGFPGVRAEAGGLELSASDEALLRLNRELRTASRVLVRLASFRASSFGELERKAKGIPWGRVLDGAPSPDAEPVRFEVTSRKSRLYHTGAVEERLRRSLEAWAHGRPARRWPAALPPQRFVVRILRDRLVLSADSSGEALHRRGYRQAVAKAPLRETVAAALILAAEWDGRCPLVDPFCGSGTLVIEGALIAASVPPGAGRRFACEEWPDFDAGDPRRAGPVHEGAAGHRPDPAPTLLGVDRDPGALEAARGNAIRAGVDGWVSWIHEPLSRAPLPELPAAPDADGDSHRPRGLLVTNPPWGRRTGDQRKLRNLYARLGTRLREDWVGGRAVVLCPDRALVGQLGLETRTLFRTSVGGIVVEAVAMDVP